MTSAKATVATTGAEIREHARAARRNSSGGIILVPVDFSDHSAAALLQASEYAHAMKATLVVLHVVHDPGEMPGYYAKLIKKKRATRIQDMAAEAFDQFMDEIIEANEDLASLQDAGRLMVTGLPPRHRIESGAAGPALPGTRYDRQERCPGTLKTRNHASNPGITSAYLYLRTGVGGR
jgi:hypothetical protein